MKCKEDVGRIDENRLPLRTRFYKCSGRRSSDRPRKRWVSQTITGKMYVM